MICTSYSLNIIKIKKNLKKKISHTLYFIFFIMDVEFCVEEDTWHHIMAHKGKQYLLKSQTEMFLSWRNFVS